MYQGDVVLEVVIYMQPGGSPSTIVGPFEIFNTAGRTFRRLTGQPGKQLFQVTLASHDGKPVTFLNGLQINADARLKDLAAPDIVMIGSCGADIQPEPDRDGAIVDWLKRAHQNGAVIASVCTGLGLLAETGLLDGKQATTHWGSLHDFRKLYPAIEIKGDQLFIENGNVLTGGGSYAGNDLALFIVEKFFGAEVKQETARALVLDAHRPDQSAYAGIMHHRIHSDPQIHLVQDWLDQRYRTDVNFDDVAKRFNMSPRNFHRRFRQASGETPLTYLQKQRIEAAKSLLENSTNQIDQVAAAVGYTDTNHFRRLFKRLTSHTPKSWRERFSDG